MRQLEPLELCPELAQPVEDLRGNGGRANAERVSRSADPSSVRGRGKGGKGGGGKPTGFSGGGTSSSWSALISCAISKHSSSSPLRIAWPVGTLLPPGPRNFPSTRFESIFRSSSTSALTSALGGFSSAASDESWRRIETSLWWIGTSSTERTESDLKSASSKRSVARARPTTGGRGRSSRQTDGQSNSVAKTHKRPARPQHRVTGRTRIVELPAQQLLHLARQLAALDLMRDDRPELGEPRPVRLEIRLGVDARLVHVLEELLRGRGKGGSAKRGRGGGKRGRGTYAHRGELAVAGNARSRLANLSIVRTLESAGAAEEAERGSEVGRAAGGASSLPPSLTAAPSPITHPADERAGHTVKKKSETSEKTSESVWSTLFGELAEPDEPSSSAAPPRPPTTAPAPPLAELEPPTPPAEFPWPWSEASPPPPFADKADEDGGGCGAETDRSPADASSRTVLSFVTGSRQGRRVRGGRGGDESGRLRAGDLTGRFLEGERGTHPASGRHGRLSRRLTQEKRDGRFSQPLTDSPVKPARAELQCPTLLSGQPLTAHRPR